MNTRLLTLPADAADWDGYLTRLPDADIYHTAAYHAAHQANGDGMAMAFVAEEGGALRGHLLFHPFMQREVGTGDWCDIATVYGYGGPLFLDRPGVGMFLGDAWGEFDALCRERRQVAEFIRFSPLSDNWRAVTDCTPALDRPTVVLDLAGSKTDLWAHYTARHRNMIRKAEGRGLELLPVELPGSGEQLGWPAFRRLYAATMERNGASKYYTFTDAYFAALQAMPEVKLFAVTDGYTALAAAIFLAYRDRLHYHLAASNRDGPSLGASNLLLHKAALWGQAHGCRWLHLGGGRTAAADDSLLRFKASISRECRAFYVGRRIHDTAVYLALCSEWLASHGLGYFPLYRLERGNPAA